MRFLPNWPMELVLMTALGIAVIVIVAVIALREPPGDRTRFTLERSDAAQVVGERGAPLVAEESALGR